MPPAVGGLGAIEPTGKVATKLSGNDKHGDDEPTRPVYPNESGNDEPTRPPYTPPGNDPSVGDDEPTRAVYHGAPLPPRDPADPTAMYYPPVDNPRPIPPAESGDQGGLGSKSWNDLSAKQKFVGCGFVILIAALVVFGLFTAVVGSDPSNSNDEPDDTTTSSSTTTTIDDEEPSATTTPQRSTTTRPATTSPARPSSTTSAPTTSAPTTTNPAEPNGGAGDGTPS